MSHTPQDRDEMVAKVADILHAGISELGISNCPLWSCRAEHEARARAVVDALFPKGRTR
jgi:hypothetical protein